ncbi:MAG: 6-bladed beta-propeller [Prevotellaceae bacterium]|nr:6-bladed beta-propeller [Prevotellaceae bacterium]
MQRFLFVVMVPMLLCCTILDKSRIIGQIPNPDIINISVYQPVPIDVKTLFSEIGFIKLDTSAVAAIGSASELRVYKNHIYVLDSNGESVLMFDMSGTFIRRIGAIGRGPKEMLSMKNIEIDYIRDRLFITDNYGRQTTAFDLEGNYLFKVPLGDPGGFIAITPSGNIVHESQMSTFGWDYKTMIQRENIKILDTLGSLIQKGFDYNYNRRINALFRTLSMDKSGEITFLPMFRDTVYSITDYAITPLFSFDFSKVHGISKKRSDTYFDCEEMNTDLKKNGYVCLAGKHLNSQNYFYAQLGCSIDRSHLFYNKKTKDTHIVKLYDYAYENGYLPVKNITLFNGVSSALIPYQISDYCDGYFYGIFDEVQQMILKNLNPKVGTLERQLLDSICPDGSDILITYLKIKN